MIRLPLIRCGSMDGGAPGLPRRFCALDGAGRSFVGDFTASIGSVTHIGVHLAAWRRTRVRIGGTPRTRSRPTAHGPRAANAFLRRAGASVW